MMDTTIRKVHLVAKRGNPEAMDLGGEIGAWFEEQGVSWHLTEHKAVGADPHPASGPHRPDLVLVLGGDGTFISEARRALEADVPLLGLNMGNVGFLAEVSSLEWRNTLTGLLDAGFPVKRRSALRFEVEREGAVMRQGVAVNDLVVSRGALARLVRLGVLVNGERAAGLRADGIIVSTPSGATAYGVSAGGPLVHPDMSCMCVTPICAFLSGFKSMVLPEDASIDLVVEGKWGDVNLTVDGQAHTPLKTGDRVAVACFERGLKVVDVGRGDYFTKLRNRGFIVDG